MKLDNDLLRKMIAETLGAALEEQTDAEIQKARSEAADAEKQKAKAAIKAAEEKADVSELEAEKAAAEAKQEAGGTMEESFQMTKGRLRQIIAEEMKKAKEQGLL